MKTRLYTFLIRWYSAQSKALPRWLVRACENNPHLASERSREEALSTQLKVPPERPQVHPDRSILSARILAAMGEKGSGPPQPVRAAASTGSLWRVIAMPVAAAAAVAFFLTMSVSTLSEQGSEGDAGLEITSRSLTPVETLVDVETTLLQNSLDQEVENVLADAKGAVGFLALSFLPSSFAEELLADGEDASS